MANLALVTSRKSADYYSPISKHLDEWQRISREYRDQKLGQHWFDDCEAFYQLINASDPLPSFRPLIRVPQLQVLMMHEANDLSETSPRPYIVDNVTGNRDSDRERSLQAAWRYAQVNYHSMYATLMSLYSGMCPMQVGYSPDARQGRGSCWVKMRDPRSFDCDPTADYTCNWSWVMFEDREHLDKVKSDWGAAASRIRPRVSGRTMSPMLGDPGYGVQMPPGPMSLVPGLPHDHSIPSDNRVRVRRCFLLDYTREKIEDHELPGGEMVPADFAWRYPNGRMIVECEGYTLFDGDNPYPLKMFPVAPFWSSLPLYGVWATPAIRYSKSLQDVGERLYTSLFENAVRLNNGVW